MAERASAIRRPLVCVSARVAATGSGHRDVISRRTWDGRGQTTDGVAPWPVFRIPADAEPIRAEFSHGWRRLQNGIAMNDHAFAALAAFVLAVHVVIIVFNIAGLLVVPLGARLRWDFVRVRWLRVLHLLSLAVV